MITIWRILLYGIQGFRRNIWLSIIAIITMTLTLMTLTIFFLGDVVASRQYQEFNNKIDYVIFVKDTASDADVQSFVQQVTARPEVGKVGYLSKEDARKNFESQFNSNDDLKGVIDPNNNPLPREVDVSFHSPSQDIGNFDHFVQDPRFTQIVEKTSYKNNKASIDNYIRTTNVLKVVGIFFTAFFMLIAVLVILNTIRLAIFARREEIEIMRLVGATSGYIRGPFLIEGLLFGIIGSLLSAVMFWAVLRQLQLILQDSQRYGTTNVITQLLNSSFAHITTVHGFNTLFSQLLLIQLSIGLLLGVVCSYMAARRYLRG